MKRLLALLILFTGIALQSVAEMPDDGPSKRRNAEKIAARKAERRNRNARLQPVVVPSPDSVKIAADTVSSNGGGAESAENVAARAEAERVASVASLFYRADSCLNPCAADLHAVYDSLTRRLRAEAADSIYTTFFNELVDLDSTGTTASSVPDSVYAARLAQLISPIWLPYNDIIKRYIIAYTETRKQTFSRILGRSQYYFPIIEEELMRAGLPLELRMVPVIESALTATAVSRMGATGLWQFMYGTGKLYGLEQTSFIDQRRDPLASTRAACRYLKNMYDIYQDWTLAIASYNCGPGNVNKALARAGEGARTFWDIYPYLPRETRGYVPSFIAATYAYAYHTQHGIEPTESPLPLATDTIMVGRLMHLEQVATTLDVPMELLRDLNPQYKLDIIPAVEGKQYSLVLPSPEINHYIQMEDSIHAKDTVYLAQYQKKIATPGGVKSTFNISTVTYKVKKGDQLGSIAHRYGVTVSQLMKWNGIKNPNTLQIGKVLEIYR